jgi:hypothetical protein
MMTELMAQQNEFLARALGMRSNNNNNNNILPAAAAAAAAGDTTTTGLLVAGANATTAVAAADGSFDVTVTVQPKKPKSAFVSDVD